MNQTSQHERQEPENSNFSQVPKSTPTAKRKGLFEASHFISGNNGKRDIQQIVIGSSAGHSTLIKPISKKLRYGETCQHTDSPRNSF